jgi:hypothetical protein
LADRRRCAACLAALLLVLLPRAAAADWYFTPFIGYDLRGTTTFVADLEYNRDPRTKVTFGGSAMLVRGILGLEADYAVVPGFFERDVPEVLVVASYVQTITGNVMVLAPLSLTQESIRPYVVAGFGWMDVYSEPFRVGALLVDQDLVAFNAGGGAIGMFGPRTGLRFDVRFFTNLDRDTPSGTTIGSARVKFWRATVGFVLRY